jgi:hypothetical protein
MMHQGFFPLERVHPHTLGIWAEVFMCEYNGYSSNKIYKRCDHIVFFEVAVLWATVMVLLHGCNHATMSVKVYTTDVYTLAVWATTNLSQWTQVGNIFFEAGSSSRQHGKSSRDQTGTLTMISWGHLASLPCDILYHLLPNGKRSVISLLFT